MQRFVRGWERRLLGLALGCLLAGGSTARADDVTTLSGQTFQDVRIVRVEPDGVTWLHATGMVKVDFADLPAPMRKAYHYDAGKAAAFQAAQAQALQQAAARAQQLQRDRDARRAQRFRERPAAITVSAGATPDYAFHNDRDPIVEAAARAIGAQIADKPGATPGFAFHNDHDRAVEATAQAIGTQIAAQKAAQAKLTEDDGTIWDRRIWAIPRMLFGGSDGHLFDPPDTNSDEYKRRVFCSPANREYYYGLDRAEAFARGHP